MKTAIRVHSRFPVSPGSNSSTPALPSPYFLAPIFPCPSRLLCIETSETSDPPTPPPSTPPFPLPIMGGRLDFTGAVRRSQGGVKVRVSRMAVCQRCHSAVTNGNENRRAGHTLRQVISWLNRVPRLQT